MGLLTATCHIASLHSKLLGEACSVNGAVWRPSLQDCVDKKSLYVPHTVYVCGLVVALLLNAVRQIEHHAHTWLCNRQQHSACSPDQASLFQASALKAIVHHLLTSPIRDFVDLLHYGVMRCGTCCGSSNLQNNILIPATALHCSWHVLCNRLTVQLLYTGLAHTLC